MLTAQTTTWLVLEPVIPPTWAAVMALALAVVVVAGARRWPLAGKRWWVLVVLRLLVVVAVACLMLRPEVRWQGRRAVRGEVVVLLDASRSMGIRDAVAADGSPVARSDAVRDAFSAAAGSYTALADRAAVGAYAFGTHVRPSQGFAVTPTDARTDIAEALDFVREKTSDPFSAPSAVVLLSDGCENRSQGAATEAAQRLAEGGVKVHAVAVGAGVPTDGIRDVTVRDLRAPERVFVGNRADVRAVVATLGLAGKTVEAVLSVDGREVARRRLTPDADRTAHEIVFTPVLGSTGMAPLVVAVAPLPGELIATNNRAETLVLVEEGGIRVLYLDGRLHPEGKYLARVLAEAKEVNLARRILVGASADAAAPTPADLDAFDVVILGDLPASGLAPETVARMVERARQGGLSILTLGGLAAYGAGGWAGTPLAEVLPFAIRPGDGQVAGPIRFTPTAAGAVHFVFTDGGPGGRAIDFDALPPLSGASAVGDLHPTARLLAQSAEGAALLAVRELGQSRVAGLTVDTTWQWALAPAGTGAAEVHRRLWRGLVLWLAGRDGRPADGFWVRTDRVRYVITDPDHPPTAEIAVGSPGGPLPRARLTGPVASDVPLAPADARPGQAPARWRGTAALRAGGVYTVVAETTVGGEARRAEARFIVEVRDYELADALADHDALRRVAEAGGGTFRTLDGLPALMAELGRRPAPSAAPVERRLPLASGRAFLVVVLALLAAEWFLRRRWRLA